MYKFVKLKNTWKDMNLMLEWKLVIEDFETLKEFEKKYFDTVLDDAIQQFLDVGGHKGSKDSTRFLEAVEAFTDDGTTGIDAIQKLEFLTKNTRVKNLVQYGKIYVSPNGAYCVPSDTMVETLIEKKETMLYPNYTEKDIKLKRYPRGNHYYPRIGNMEVEHEGEIKWNTTKRANEVAKMYL